MHPNLQGANVQAALLSALQTMLNSDEQKLPSSAAAEDEADCVPSSIPVTAQQGLYTVPTMASHSIQGEHGFQ